MAFASVSAKTNFTGFTAAEQTTILNAMKTGYNGSATAKSMFDAWIATAGHTIDVKKVAGAFQAYANTGKIEIDLGYLTNANYIDNKGKAVQDTPVTAILHELVHALTGKTDDGDYVTEYRGATVKMSNKIYKELGLPEQNSYVSYDETGTILTRDREYTAGAEIDRSESGNRDWNSSAAGVSKDLLIGGAGANNLQSGRGADVLFGAGGNDNLNGGDGADIVLYTGKPTDYDIRVNPDGTWTARHVRGTADEGTDTISNIEKVRFTGDETFNLTKGGLTFQTDIAFVVDTTGSMWDDIAAVQAAANGVLDALFADGSIDARVGVVSFKDSAIGEPTQVLLPFTDQDVFADRKAAAVAAINALSASGGGDTPETAFDGLLKALDGSMGDWRVGAGTKRIALFTDAPAKDGALLPTVLAFALNIGAVISSSTSSVTSPYSRTDTFELTFGPALDGAIGRDPGSEGDDLPDFVPTDDPVAPLGGTTTVAITSIFIGGLSEPDLTEASESTGGSVLTAADPAGVVAALLSLVNTPNYQISVDRGSLDEGDDGATNVTFTITRDRSDNAAVVTLDATGDADGADVRGVPGSIAFDVGVTSVSFDVRVKGDTIVEADETFGLEIASIDEVSTISVGEAGFTIVNDDGNRGTRGDDTLVGTSGRDKLNGLAGDDLIRGLKGGDVLIGGPGDDRLFSGKGDDVLRGKGGDDFAAGRKGDDRVHGGFGHDNLHGNDGDDILIGGHGIDRAVGGAGADVFVLQAGGKSFDRVMDFEDGIDGFEIEGAGALGFKVLSESTRVFLDGDLVAIVKGDFAALDASDFVLI